MVASSWDRSRRVAVAASASVVIAVVAGAVILVLGAGLPHAWWPRIGRAFAADARSAHHDPCALIVGPAKAYCERGATATPVGQLNVAGAAWRLGTAGAGAAALVVWRCRSTARRRRR